LYNFFNPALHPTPKAVTISGSNAFGDNGVNGLVVVSLGAITLNNVTAYVSPTGTSTGKSVALSNAVTNAVGGVTLTGTNFFNDYQTSATNQDGLNIASHGAVSLNNVTANGNGHDGVAIANNSAITPQIVKLTGANTFNSNGNTGLDIESEGAVTVNDLQANNTINGDGADILNTFGAGSVTITGYGIFQGNEGNGLNITSDGAVTTNNLNAACNGFMGLCVTGTGTSDYGVLIDNHNASTPQNVSILGINIFNSNDQGGLDVASKGAVSVADVTANDSVAVAGYGVNINNAVSGAVGGVTITGTNFFDGNAADGLSVDSKGTITANNIDAESNGVYGADLENPLGSSSVKITVSGLNLFENNISDGLFINGSGSVSLTKIYAYNNHGNGLDVNEATNVTLNCGGFTGNSTDGIYVNNATTVALSGVLSDDNTVQNIEWAGGTYTNTPRDCPLP
ncbi:MAG: hypothetical protein WBW94_01350, partial [Anaerolineales bacterium]